MRSPSPHDANDTDAAAFSGELAAWQQHNAGALFPHPHGEPAITSSPLMLNFRILSRPHHPSSLWTPARLRLLFAIQPRIL